MPGFYQHNPEEDAPFNMAMLFYEEVHLLRVQKSRAMIENELQVAYDCLQEILTLAHAKFKDKEIEKVTKSLSAAKTALRNSTKEENDKEKNLSEAKDKLREADRQLIGTMNKYSMIFPRIQLTGGLKNLKEKMRLPDAKPKA